MKKLLPPILMILFVVGGAFAADTLKSSRAEKVAVAHLDEGHGKTKDVKSSKKPAGGHGKKDDGHGKKAKKDDGHGKKAKKDDGHGKKAKKDDGHGKKAKKAKKDDGHGKKAKGGHGKSDSSGGIKYLKFKRQFVVPVMKNGSIDALVIMNLNLVLDEHAPASAYAMEPKVRDAMMRSLLEMSDADVFGKNLTNPENYEVIRETLYDAAEGVLKEGLSDILILDIARQEQ